MTSNACSAAILPRAIKRGAEVWCLYNGARGWVPVLAGRVQRVTADGPVVARETILWARCPLFMSERLARTWAGANPTEVRAASKLVPGKHWN